MSRKFKRAETAPWAESVDSLIAIGIFYWR